MDTCCLYIIDFITRIRLAYKGWKNHEKLISVNVIKDDQIVKIINSNSKRELELSEIDHLLPLAYQYLQLVYLMDGKKYKILFSQIECQRRNILFPIDINKNTCIIANPFTDISISYGYGNSISISHIIDEYLGVNCDFHQSFSETMKNITIREILKINCISSKNIFSVFVLDNDFASIKFSIDETLDNLLKKTPVKEIPEREVVFT